MTTATDLFARFKRHILIFLAVLGPGFITAVVDNDSGGIFTYSAAGDVLQHAGFRTDCHRGGEQSDCRIPETVSGGLSV